MEEKEFIEKYGGCKLSFDDRRGAVVSVHMKGATLAQWEEWAFSCDRDWNGGRWTKSYNDHLKAKMYDLLIEDANSHSQKENQNELGLMSGGDENGKIYSMVRKVRDSGGIRESGDRTDS